MRIALNKRSGLRALRIVRRSAGPSGLTGIREDLAAQDPGEGRARWSKLLLESLELDGHALLERTRPLDIAVPDRDKRLQSPLVSNTVYGGTLPQGAFVPLGEVVQVACPELIFLEMAPVMDRLTHVLLGYELCGGFSRDPDDPRSGDVRFKLPPVTTPEKIRAFIEGAGRVQGKHDALAALDLVAADARSPMEALLAATINMAPEEMGFGLGPVVLNRRIDVGEGRTRVPDILFEGTEIGLNYDGRGHLDLDALAKAAADSATNPGAAAPAEAADAAKRAVREAYADDRLRERELASAGYTVFTVTEEDLKDQKRLDQLMLQVMDALERQTGRDLAEQRAFARDRRLRKDQQIQIRSAMAGKMGAAAQRRLSELRQRMYERMSETLVDIF